MKCAESIELLSDFRDGFLNDGAKTEVRTHLDGCPPCNGIFSELDLIALTASALRDDSKIEFPDEHAIWQRMRLSNPTIH